MDGAAGAAAMAQAILAGYRLLDTAAKYGNEWAVGETIRRSGAPREELFITSKLRGADHGPIKTRAALSASLDRLRLDYLDLYLIHWPLPRLGLFIESYEANLEIFGFRLSDTEMTALGALDLGEDAAVDSDGRVEF